MSGLRYFDFDHCVAVTTWVELLGMWANPLLWRAWLWFAQRDLFLTLRKKKKSNSNLALFCMYYFFVHVGFLIFLFKPERLVWRTCELMIDLALLIDFLMSLIQYIQVPFIPIWYVICIELVSTTLTLDMYLKVS